MEQLLDENEIGRTEVRYASFGARFLAAIVDFLVFLIPIGILMGALGMQVTSGPVYNIVSTVVGIAYYVLLESGPWQGTVGKKVMGLKVVDATTLEKISVGKAFGRYFACILSALILLIGYFMALFSERNQTLHDKICGTYVIKD